MKIISSFNSQIKLAFLLAIVTCTSPLFCNEISFIRGGPTARYNEGSFNQSNFYIGGRYGQQFASNMFWFTESTLNNENNNSLTSTPSNNTSFSLGGGLRYYFDRFNSRIAPYSNVYSQLISKKQLIKRANQTVLAKLNAIYIAAGWGLRISLNKKFFVDVEGLIFQHPVFGVHNEKSISEANLEESRKFVLLSTEDAGQAINSLTLAFGLRI